MKPLALLTASADAVPLELLALEPAALLLLELDEDAEVSDFDAELLLGMLVALELALVWLAALDTELVCEEPRAHVPMRNRASNTATAMMATIAAFDSPGFGAGEFGCVTGVGAA